MANRPRTIDIFAAAGREEPLECEWPAARRFPLNQDSARVEDVVLRDLRESDEPLIVTGFATLDRLIDFIASADECSEIRIVFGSEPFDSRRSTFSIKDRDLPHEMKEYWLDRGISVLLSAKLLICIERLKARTVRARYVARSSWRLHAKIYIGTYAATLGSSNFTDPGLKNQLEANSRFRRKTSAARKVSEEEGRRYSETCSIAEQFWAIGKDYNEELIDLLNALLRLVPWQEAIARASAELLEGLWAKRYLRGEYLPDEANLWPSQRLGIAQALYILKERGSVLVADATGSGKTRMGMHLIGAKMHDIISSNRLRQGKALLISPPAVVPEWQRESTRASVNVDVFSHGTLSHTSASSRDNVLDNLRRAQMLCVDEGHNFLNLKSRRTRQLLRNMADHVALFTATPINRSAADLLRIADMLGADNLDESTIKAFEKMLAVQSISRTLSDDEISELRKEIAKFTVRRTKRMLNDLIKKDPNAYRDARGVRCKFPKHVPRDYSMNEPSSDCEKAARIRELAGKLKGVLHFRRELMLPLALRNRGMTEERYLQGRLSSATQIFRYLVTRALRSSRAALIEHLIGTRAAVQRCQLEGFSKSTDTGNVVESLKRIAGKVPKCKLTVELPPWLVDPEEHRTACTEEIAIYVEIAGLVKQISDSRERAKADLLIELSQRFSHVLAFDSRPITLAVLNSLIKEREPGQQVFVATSDAQSDRNNLLSRFSPDCEDGNGALGLCSDSFSEGVNLQRAQAVVHLDMPSVVRIAEQRVGRVDRLNSPHSKIEAWWPDDAPEFALRTDEKFLERYETVENLLGSNMPLPERVRERSTVVTARDAIEDYETNADRWDGINDAFFPVRELVSGSDSLINAETYESYAGVKSRVTSRVSLIAADEPWAFFCTSDSSGVPKWILLTDPQSAPETDLQTICDTLRTRLGPGVEDIRAVTPRAERILSDFLDRLTAAERQLLSRRKQRALEEMILVLKDYIKSSSEHRNQSEVDDLTELLNVLTEPIVGIQPDWEEVAARWLDLIRPVWYEKLQEAGRHKPLLLKDIRGNLIASKKELLPRILKEFGREFPAQQSPDERIVSCIVGVA